MSCLLSAVLVLSCLTLVSVLALVRVLVLALDRVLVLVLVSFLSCSYLFLSRSCLFCLDEFRYK